MRVSFDQDRIYIEDQQGRLLNALIRFCSINDKEAFTGESGKPYNGYTLEGHLAEYVEPGEIIANA